LPDSLLPRLACGRRLFVFLRCKVLMAIPGNGSSAASYSGSDSPIATRHANGQHCLDFLTPQKKRRDIRYLTHPYRSTKLFRVDWTALQRARHSCMKQTPSLRVVLHVRRPTNAFPVASRPNPLRRLAPLTPRQTLFHTRQTHRQGRDAAANSPLVTNHAGMGIRMEKRKVEKEGLNAC
jgi:hypothetical protein